VGEPIDRRTSPARRREAGAVGPGRARLTVGWRPAAANTIARKRAVFYAALRYAVDLGHLESHPLDRLRWTAPKVAEAVDRRAVVDHERARRLFAAVREQGKTGRHLEAFFGCMYYSALRPSEAIAL